MLNIQPLRKNGNEKSTLDLFRYGVRTNASVKNRCSAKNITTIEHIIAAQARCLFLRNTEIYGYNI